MPDDLEAEAIYLVPELLPSPFRHDKRAQTENSGRPRLLPFHPGATQPLFAFAEQLAGRCREPEPARLMPWLLPAMTR
jgi:hypothetical protein